MKINKKLITLLTATGLIITAVVGTSFAYYSDATSSVTNTFTVSNVDTEIVENFKPPGVNNNSGIKEVQVKNTGTSNCYIRVRIEISPENAATVKYKDTTGTYAYNSGENTDWKLSGDFYYYNVPVSPGEYTSVLINQYIINDVFYNQGAFEPFEIAVYQEAVTSDGYGSCTDAFADY